MPKRHYALALACYLAIPPVLIGGVVLSLLIDPEMARSHADYARDYRLLEMVRTGALAATAGLTLVLWLSTCYLVLRARQRSPGWLALAAGGPFGFIGIAMLADRSPAAADDPYQHFVGRLKPYGRLALEAALFVAACLLTFGSMVLLRELMIAYESFTTGTPVASIVERQTASSGMMAFGEGLEMLYLLVIFYLLWPIVFGLAGKVLKR